MRGQGLMGTDLQMEQMQEAVELGDAGGYASMCTHLRTTDRTITR